MPEPEKKRLVEHLEDLRRVIIYSTVAFAAAFILLLPVTPRVVKWLHSPLNRVVGAGRATLRTVQVTGAFSATMHAAFAAALVVSAPLIIWFVWRFVFPALKEREAVVLRSVLVAALLLFAAGATVGYAVILPAAMKVMWQWHEWLGVRPEWTVNSYLTFALHLMLAFGLGFELPLLVLATGMLGLVSSRQLRQYRRHVIVMVLVLAALLTPPDVFTQIVMALPLILLYECCVVVLALWERRYRREVSKP